MLEKPFLATLLGRLKHGDITVTFWDGETKRFGPEKPWLAITFHDPSVVRAARRNLEMALGEGYVDRKIDIDGDLADLGRLAEANRTELAKWLPNLKAKKRNSTNLEVRDVQHHYDLGNDFYKLWLDDSMTYSCAYFRRTSDSLERAQRQKIDHTLRKLDLKPGMRLLDIGSGWGQLLFRAAERGVNAHGITASREQYEHTKRLVRERRLSKRVSVELGHYEQLSDRRPYDRVVSVGMYEHVGAGNHHRYMTTVNRVLKPGGLSLLHTITEGVDRPLSLWIDKYVFPGGDIPTLHATLAELSVAGFRTLDVENLRRHYAMTLNHWTQRFERAAGTVAKMYDERFVRMWRFYLRGSYGGFAYGNLDLHQILFSKGLADDAPLTREYIYQPTRSYRPARKTRAIKR